MKERICYYCKHLKNCGMFAPDYRCEINDEKVETYHYCNQFDDGESEDRC